GLTDGTVPLEGRNIRGGAFAQGDLFASKAILRRVDGCPRNPDHHPGERAMGLRYWDRSCTSGRPLVMAIQPRGPETPSRWVGIAWDWVQSLAREPAVSEAPPTPVK